MRLRRTLRMPSSSAALSTRFAVGRDVPASDAMSSWVRGMTTPVPLGPVRVPELDEAAQHPRLGRDEQRLLEPAREAADLGREDLDEEAVDLGVLAPQGPELIAAQRLRLDGLRRETTVPVRA